MNTEIMNTTRDEVMIPKSKIFVWNDENTTLVTWCNVIKEAGFSTYSTNVTDVDRVVKKFESDFANLVLLDLLDDSKQPLGYQIASKIRSKDPLVPIVIVTRDPFKLFDNEYSLDELDVQGYYAATIMNRAAAFKEIVVRRNLSQWHQLAPDNLLVRHAFKCLSKYQERSKYCDTITELKKILWNLPVSCHIDSWHKMFSKTMGDFFIVLGFPNIKKIFEKTIELFQIADPFYMAAGKSRRHLSHNVQVFLLGLIVLDKYELLRKEAINSIGGIFPDKSNKELFLIAMAVWGGVALTHDTAYLSQYLKIISESLKNLAKQFQVALTASEDLKSWDWPDIHHGAVGAKLWLCQISQTEAGLSERKLTELIARGIALHDSNITDDDFAKLELPYKNVKETLSSTNWISFLATLADELQTWNRDRDDRPKDYRLFALDDLNFVNEADGLSVLWLTFTAKNHPRAVLEATGARGYEQTIDEFRRIRDKLTRSLDSRQTLKIKLRVVIEGFSDEPSPVTVNL